MEERQSIKLIIWDWNGTLHDDARASWESVNDMLARRDMDPITFEQYSSYVETPIIGFYRHIFDLDKISFDQIAVEFHSGFDLHMKGRGLMPGAVEVLDAFRDAGIKQVIVSSSEKGQLMRYAESYGILDRFDAVLGADDLEAGSKIDRARSYIERCGIAPQSTLVVGDLLHDAEMAQAIGARCALVAKGHQLRRHLEPGGSLILDDISELIPMVLG